MALVETKRTNVSLRVSMFKIFKFNFTLYHINFITITATLFAQELINISVSETLTFCFSFLFHFIFFFLAFEQNVSRNFENSGSSTLTLKRELKFFAHISLLQSVIIIFMCLKKRSTIAFEFGLHRHNLKIWDKRGGMFLYNTFHKSNGSNKSLWWYLLANSATWRYCSLKL